MKYETLLKRYKSLGYEIKGYADKDMEIQSIVKWLLYTKNIFVFVHYYSHVPRLIPNIEHKFSGCYQKDCGCDNTIFCSHENRKYFDNPADAYFDTLRLMIPILFFRKNYGG